MDDSPLQDGTASDVGSEVSLSTDEDPVDAGAAETAAGEGSPSVSPAMSSVGESTVAQHGGAGQAGAGAPTPAPAVVPAESGPIAEPPAPKKSRLMPVAIIAAALAVLSVVLLVVFVVPIGGAPQSKGASITLVMRVPGYDDGSSPIPFRVTGTDADGNDVDEIRTVASPDSPLELPEGTYTVQPAGSPVTSDGNIYRYPTAQYTVVVSKAEGAQSSDSGYVASVNGVEGGEVAVDYDPIEANRVTEEEMKKATEWVSQSNLDPETVDHVNQSIEGAAERAYHVVTDFFELDVPEYWRGKVRWDVLEFQENAYLTGAGYLTPVQVVFYALPTSENGLQKEEELAIVYASLNETAALVPDRFSSVGTSIEEHGFHVFDVEDLWYAGMDPDLPGLAALVDLQTGGKGKMPTGMYQIDTASRESAEAFFREELTSSIKPTLTDEASAHDLLKRAYHVSSDYFEFDIPEYWWGKVTWTVSKGRANYTTEATIATVYCKGSTDYDARLIDVSDYPMPPKNNPDAWVGSLGAIPVYSIDQGGRRLRLTANDPGSVLRASSKQTSSKPYDQNVIDLNSGGQVTLSTLSAFGERDIYNISKDYLEQQVVSTIKVKH